MKKAFLFLVLAFSLMTVQGKSLQEQIDSVRVLLPTAEDDSLKLLYLTFLSDLFMTLHELDSAEKYARMEVRFGKDADFDKAIGAGLYSLCLINIYRGKSEEALLVGLAAIDAFDRAGNEKGKTFVYNILGHMYSSRRDNHHAISYFKKSRAIRLQLNDTMGLSHSATYLANCYVVLHQLEGYPLDSGAKYAQEALRLARSLDTVGITSPLSTAYEANALVYAVGNERRKAIALYKRVLERYRKEERKLQVVGALKQLGQQYLMLDELDEAEAYMQQALKQAEEIGSQKSILSLQMNLSDLHFRQGKIELAFQELRNYHAVYDSTVNSERNDQLVELEKKYETAQKEQRIELLEQQFKVSELQQERQAILLTLVIVVSLLAILLFVLIYISQRSRNRRQRLELERKLLRAQMNPHFIFNSLSSIQRLYIDGDIDLANDFMADFANLLREILDATGKQRISIRDEVKTLQRYLHLEEARLNGKLTWELEVDEEIDQQQAMMPPLIIQPFVENAIWHGIVPKDGPGHIKIQLFQIEENTVLCKVTDDGVGLGGGSMQGKKMHESKGIKLSETRLGRKNAVQIGNRMDGGTLVSLQIDVNYEDQGRHHRR